MAGGWSREKRLTVERAFYAFLDRSAIISKDHGRICLGESLYWGQRYAITQIFDALERDVHDIYILKSRQLGMCYDPKMRVLTADLRWLPIDQVRVGNEVVAVDEFVPGGKGAARKMRTARVEAVREVFEPAYKLTMDNGVELIATAEHRHLCRHRGALHTEWRAVGRTKVGDHIRYVTQPWDEASYEDGWYGGILDGEGSISTPKKAGVTLGISQVDGPVLCRARAYLETKGFSYREEVDRRKPGASSKFGTKNVHKLIIRRMSELFQLVGQTRPSRFISKRWWEGRELPGKRNGLCWSEVVKVESLGKRRMIDLQTSEKTFICEGFVSHNSTIVRAVIVFFEGMFPGTKGAIVFDTDGNKQEAHSELEAMISELPKSLKFPGLTNNNRRMGLSLKNGSKILMMSAGVKKSKTSGTLGRSVGISLATLSELCSYDNDEGLEAFDNSLSDVNPDRLYIRESTARGFNSWWKMWQDARNDPLHKCCIFLGWWCKDSQKIDQDSVDFEIYGKAPPADKELEKIAAVKKQYGYQITVEQLAWIRRKMDPSFQQKVDEAEGADMEANPLRIQEQPWTEEDAFQQTGSVFFAANKLTEITRKHASNKFKGYMFWCGAEFQDMRVHLAENLRMTELKVWEEPDPEGFYTLGVDPAFGENENNDRSSIEVFRCYADGIDQVAEYTWPLITTYQFAWVIAALMGWYGQGNAEVRYILELNGPGGAVFNELKQLKTKIDLIRHNRDVAEKGLADVFRNVRTYIYSRNDSMTGGAAWHWKTNIGTKVQLMERFRDFVSNGKCRIRSMALIDEMKTVAREGDSIAAPGSLKDDRVVAAALACHNWEVKMMTNLLAQRRTRETEEKRKRLSIVDQVALFQQNQLEAFFKTKQVNRFQQRQQQIRAGWRAGSRPAWSNGARPSWR